MSNKIMELADVFAAHFAAAQNPEIGNDVYGTYAALEAEVNRVTAERDALRAAAQAGLKMLLDYPRETRTVWKDGIDLDLPCPNKPLDDAITQLQAALKGKS